MKGLLLTAATILGLAPAIASANTTLKWDVFGTDHGSGTITLGANDNGGFDIVSFTGTLDGNAVSLIGGQPGWLPGPPNSNTPPGITAAPEYSTDGLTYDNIYYPGNSPDIPCFGPVSTQSNQNADAYGILFSFNGGEGEIWGNGTHSPYIFGVPGRYTFEVATGIMTPVDNSTTPYTPQTPIVSYYTDNIGFQVGVPEPSTWAMMVLGLGGLGGVRRLRRRQAAQTA